MSPNSDFGRRVLGLNVAVDDRGAGGRAAKRVFATVLLAVTATSADLFGQSVYSIGVIDGRPEDVLGEVTDVAIDPAGGVLVLDRLNHVIRWFDRSGEYRTRVGRRGHGPAEFNEPRAIAIDGTDRVWVLDAGNARVTAFDLNTEAGSVRYAFDFPLLGTSVPDDMCVLDSGIYVLFPFDNPTIKVFDREGGAQPSIGPAVEPDGYAPSTSGERLGAMRSFFNQGSIACDRESNRIFHVPEMIPTVRSFDVDGSLAWSVSIDPYYRVRWEVRDGRCCLYQPDPETRKVSETILVSSTEAGLVLSLQEFDARSGARSWEALTLLPHDGQIVSRSPTEELHIATQGGSTYSYTQTPFPRVLIRR